MKNKMFKLFLLSLLPMGLNGCENVEAYKIESIKEKNKNEISEINFGEEVILEHYNGGKYGLKINKISSTDERNAYASYDAKNVFIINFTFENYSINEDILISEGTDFKVFDQNNNQLKLYPLSSVNKCPVPMSMGGISTGNIVLGSENLTENLRIEIYNQGESVSYINVNLDNLN